VLAGIEGHFHEFLVHGHAHTYSNCVDLRVFCEPARVIENMMGAAPLCGCRRAVATRVADCGDLKSWKVRQCWYMCKSAPTTVGTRSDNSDA
jgi:hypothetical protein